MHKTVSVIIAAYNEQENIQAALQSAVQFFGGKFDDYELLVFNDGSRDQTGDLAEKMAKDNPRIKVIHNPGNKGLAYIAKEGIKRASKNYITFFPGDNSIDSGSLSPIIDRVGEADIIAGYMANSHVRSPIRRFFSRSFTLLMNFLFNLRLSYYNGATVYPAHVAKKMRIYSNGYDYLAELLIRSVKSGHSYKEASFMHKHDPNAKSRALSLKNFISATVFPPS